MAAIRQVMTLEYRVAEPTAEISALELREADTRERVIRLEALIEMAMHGRRRRE